MIYYYTDARKDTETIQESPTISNSHTFPTLFASLVFLQIIATVIAHHLVYQLHGLDFYHTSGKNLFMDLIILPLISTVVDHAGDLHYRTGDVSGLWMKLGRSMLYTCFFVRPIATLAMDDMNLTSGCASLCVTLLSTAACLSIPGILCKSCHTATR